MKIPASVDCETMPTDTHKKESDLKFRIYEVVGFEIYDAGTLKPIPSSEPLEPGRKIVLDDSGEYAALEVQGNDSGLFATAGQTRYLLKQSSDFRACWVCYCVMNMRAFMPRTKETLFK